MSSKTEIFTIKTFSEDYPEITVKLFAPSNKRLTVGRVKRQVGETLKLKEESLKIFGLFLGTLGSPRELLSDAEFVPEDTYELIFQRLSFDEEEELVITNEDDYAMNLIFWEAKYLYEHDMILPRPKQETLSNIKALLLPEEGESVTFKPNLSRMKNFMEIIHSIPFFYWSLYYRADYCTLRSSIASSGSYIGEGREINVVMNIEKLLFLDVSGNNIIEIASWFWDEVHLLRIEKSAQHLIMFEVMTEDQGESCKDVLKWISIESDCSKYLYSIAVHILNVLEEKFVRKHFHPPEDHTYEVVNPSFRKKMVSRTDTYYTAQKVEELQEEKQ